MQKFGSLRSQHALCFMLLPFWYSFVVIWRVFPLSPWSKVSLHGQTGSSDLSLSGMDSVGIPEFWSWCGVLLPKVFVTLKDIISWWKTKIQQLSKYSKVKHILRITFLFQIYISKSFFKHYLFRKLHGRLYSVWYLQSLQSSSRQRFLFTLSE